MGSAGKKIKKTVTDVFNPINPIKDSLTPDMPALPEQKAMPDQGDAETSAKARARNLMRRKGTGRASTVLTGGKSTLG